MQAAVYAAKGPRRITGHGIELGLATRRRRCQMMIDACRTAARRIEKHCAAEQSIAYGRELPPHRVWQSEPLRCAKNAGPFSSGMLPRNSVSSFQAAAATRVTTCSSAELARSGVHSLNSGDYIGFVRGLRPGRSAEATKIRLVGAKAADYQMFREGRWHA